MKVYHVTYLEPGEVIATGKNYVAHDEIQALELFRMDFPKVIFLHIASEEMMGYKY